jgi:preprotein translocase subunit SecE
MSETTVEKPKKKSWFKGLKAEFKKIIWPDKKTLVKQTVAVITCSVILGAIIAVIDALVQYGLNIFVG